MVSLTRHATLDVDDLGDDIDARCAHIRQRILDGIEATLDDLMRPATARDAIAETAWSFVAPQFCARATCRRAQRCRSTPCVVTRRGDFFPKVNY